MSEQTVLNRLAHGFAAMERGAAVVPFVTATGAKVGNLVPGEVVAVLVMVDSCRVCRPCLAQDEIYCKAVPTTTFDGVDRIDGTRTRGGYADTYVPTSISSTACPQGSIWPVRHRYRARG